MLDEQRHHLSVVSTHSILHAIHNTMQHRHRLWGNNTMQ
jgi:hypothetical protein